MTPSRIVKSAYRKAVKAGFQGSLKAFVHATLNDDHMRPSEREIKACSFWADNKAKQRKPGLRGEVREQQQHTRAGTHGGH